MHQYISFRTAFFAIAIVVAAVPKVSATSIQFAGDLGLVSENTGAGIYSATPEGTSFTGTIDDETFSGSLSDGTTTVEISCCVNSTGLTLTNNVTLSVEQAGLLNAVTDTGNFSEGQSVDLVEIEGDDTTQSGGRFEFGVSYVLKDTAFVDEDLSNYPFQSSDQLAGIFFILEEDAMGEDIYAGFGGISAVPLPAGVYLLGVGLVGLARATRRPAV